MAETKIEWCDYVFSPWTGCQKVSPGCANCYAEPIAKRFSLGSWGPNGERKIASENYWQQPLKWNRKAERDGIRRRVFCASMADVLEDRPELIETRGCLFELIRRTDNLDWLMLTKRPGNFARMLPWMNPKDREGPFRNVWLGVSVENQATADERIPLLLRTPAAVRFLSVEPLLSAVDFRDYPDWWDQIDWIIAGGESGPHARPCSIDWIRSIVRQCEAAGVACFVKQLGAMPTDGLCGLTGEPRIQGIKDKKGGDPNEWPEDLRIRQFPEVVPA